MIFRDPNRPTLDELVERDSARSEALRNLHSSTALPSEATTRSLVEAYREEQRRADAREALLQGMERVERSKP